MNISGLHMIAPREYWRGLPREFTPAEIEAAKATPKVAKYAGVGIIRVRGVMEKNSDGWYGVASSMDTAMAIKEAVIDPDVSVILLSIDSPGGSVDGLAELGDAIYKARQVKPVFAQVDGMAASAAYYAASQATRIYAHRMDMVGSIGTYMVIDDASQYFEDMGVVTHVIATGEHKGAGIMGSKVTEGQLAEFQRIVNTYFEDFVKMIERGRGMARAQIEPLADGRVWIGAEAVSNGLIDGIQTFEQTFAQASNLANPGTPLRDRAARLLRLKKAEMATQSGADLLDHADAEPDAHK